MIKKIIIILFCSIIVFSCGKKGDPEYKGFLDKTIIQNKIIKTS